MNVKEYHIKPRKCEAVQVTRENAAAAARWAGGYVTTVNNPEGVAVAFPGKYGANYIATIGDYITRHPDGHHELGVRSQFEAIWEETSK
jgi:hypothetical protein|nr:MAG TPA: hypothetical protein [Caudoviricetes sp.]